MLQQIIKRVMRHPAHRWLPFLPLVMLLAVGCTITISPMRGLSWHSESTSTEEPTPTPTASPAGAASDVAVAPPTNQPVSINTTFGWGVIGFDGTATPITMDIKIDHAIYGRLFDDEFFTLNNPQSILVKYLQQQGIALENVTLEYAVVSNGDEGELNQDWTLYSQTQPQTIVTATYAFGYSSLIQGLPYTITKTIVLSNEAELGGMDCAQNLQTGVECLQEIVGSGNALLARPPAFLILSYPMDGGSHYIMSWFWITPAGEEPQEDPGGADGICGFCQTVCDGQGWCQWICPLCSTP